MKALVIEDAPEYQLAATSVLERNGFTVATSATGLEGLDVAASIRPDLVILDLGLPDLDGLEVCRRLRRVSDAYIVMVTARVDDTDLAEGFAAGADDYVTKPFSVIALEARIGAVMRRARRRLDGPVAGALQLGSDGRTVSCDDGAVELTRTEYRILERLLRDTGEVVSRDALAQVVWGAEWDGVSHAIDAHVSNLRGKLRRLDWDGSVASVRGIGLRLVEPATQS